MTTSPTAPAIETTALAKRYGSTTALAGLTMRVPAGEVFGFLGPNGAGKTTTVKLLLGLARPTRGNGQVLGAPLGDLATRRRIGYLPELFRYQPWLNARDVLGLHADLIGLPQTTPARPRRGLELVGLTDAPTTGSDVLEGDAAAARPRRRAARRAGPRVPRRADVGARSHRSPGRPDDHPDAARRGAAVFLNSHLLSEVEQVCDRGRDHRPRPRRRERIARRRPRPSDDAGPGDGPRAGRSRRPRRPSAPCRRAPGSSSGAARPSASPTSSPRSWRPVAASTPSTPAARRSRSGSSSSWVIRPMPPILPIRRRPRDEPGERPRHRPAHPPRGAPAADPAGAGRPHDRHRRPHRLGVRGHRGQRPPERATRHRDPRRGQPVADPRGLHVQLRARDDGRLPGLAGHLRGPRVGRPARDRRPAHPTGRDPRRQVARPVRYRRRLRGHRRPPRDRGRDPDIRVCPAGPSCRGALPGGPGDRPAHGLRVAQHPDAADRRRGGGGRRSSACRGSPASS